MSNVVNRGTAPNDQEADTLYDAFGKVNVKFAEQDDLKQVQDATEKATPVDADTVPLIDSAVEGENPKLKWLSWANIKATLKTYFDTLYSIASDISTAISDHSGDATAHHDNTNDPSADEKAALDGTGIPSALNKYVTDDDGRLSDDRSPTAHKSTHETGGSDALSPSDIGAAADNHNHSGVYEPVISTKGTAFNKDFGSVEGSVAEGNDGRLSDSREWTADIVSKEEAEAGTVTTARKWTAQRVAQAIAALGGSGGGGLEVNTELTADTTLTASHANKYIPVNSATAKNITINGSVFAANDVVAIEQTGAGIVTIVQGSGMTLNGDKKSWGQYSVLYIFFKSATVATVVGGSA